MAELTTDREPPSIPADRPAVNDTAGYHLFEPSEFAPQSGRCDRCGGGELAEIHQKPVDQMARIADALEEIAGAFHRIEDHFRKVNTGPTAAIDAVLDRAAYVFKCNGVWYATFAGHGRSFDTWKAAVDCAIASWKSGSLL